MNLSDTDYNTLVYLDALWRRKYLFFLCMLIMPILAIMSTYLLPQKYQASTSIAININALPALKDISSPIDVVDQFQTLKAFITAPSTLQQIVIKAGLVSPKSNESVIKSAANNLSKQLTITLLEKSVIEVQLIQHSPKHMVDILNALSSLLIQRFNTQQSTSTQASVILLSSALEMQRIKLKDAVDSLRKFETTHNDALPEYGDIYQNELRQINSSLSAKQAELTSTEAEKKELEKALLSINPAALQLDRAILDNNVKLSKLRLIYTDNYPGIQTLLQIDKSLKAERNKLHQQLQGLDKDKIQQLWNISLSSTGSNNEKSNPQLLTVQLEKYLDMQLKLKGMAQAIDTLTQQQSTINKKLQFITDNKQQFVELKQTIKDNQTAYEDLLNRLNLAKMSIGFNKDDKSNLVRVVAYPESPTTSLSRPLSFFFFLGIVAGFFFGISIPIVLELIDNTARNRRAIEETTGFEVLCRVQRMRLE